MRGKRHKTRVAGIEHLVGNRLSTVLIDTRRDRIDVNVRVKDNAAGRMVQEVRNKIACLATT